MFVALPSTIVRPVSCDEATVGGVMTLITSAAAQKIAAVVAHGREIGIGRRDPTVVTRRRLRGELLLVGVLAVGSAGGHRQRKSVVDNRRDF